MTVQRLRRLLCALLGPADFQKGVRVRHICEKVLMIICAFICEKKKKLKKMLFSQEVD